MASVKRVASAHWHIGLCIGNCILRDLILSKFVLQISDIDCVFQFGFPQRQSQSLDPYQFHAFDLGLL